MSSALKVFFWGGGDERRERKRKQVSLFCHFFDFSQKKKKLGKKLVSLFLFLSHLEHGRKQPLPPVEKHQHHPGHHGRDREGQVQDREQRRLPPELVAGDQQRGRDAPDRVYRHRAGRHQEGHLDGVQEVGVEHVVDERPHAVPEGLEEDVGGREEQDQCHVGDADADEEQAAGRVDVLAARAAGLGADAAARRARAGDEGASRSRLAVFVDGGGGDGGGGVPLRASEGRERPLGKLRRRRGRRRG